MPVINIGMQSGGPGNGLAWPKVHLYQLLKKHCLGTYCAAIDEFSMVLRVSGHFDDFGPEGLERIRRRRAARYITIDIVVPVSRWQDRDEAYLKSYLAQQVRAALLACVSRLERDRETIDAEALLGHVDDAIAEFLASPTPHQPWPTPPATPTA